MNPLKIGFVLDDTLDSTDGVQQYILTLGNWMRLQGHDIHYLVGETKRTDIAGVHSMSRNKKVRFNGNHMSMPLPADTHSIKKLLDTERFDVLHVQMPYSPLMAGKVISMAPPEACIIGTFHIAPNSSIVTVANRALGLWQQRSLRHFDYILSVSKAASDFARSAYGLSTTVVPNVIDTARFKQAQPIDRKNMKKHVMFLGRLVERKGCQIFLEALNQLVQEDGLPSFEATVCGRGPLEQELRAYVAANGLQDIVTFAGFVDDEQKARYLKSADVAVFPSTGGESFGIVLIEAMAADNPVVLGAANPGYSSVLGPYPELLVPVGESHSLAVKIRQFLTDDTARQSALEWQRSYVRQFDVGTVGQEIISIYRQALHSADDVQ